MDLSVSSEEQRWLGQALEDFKDLVRRFGDAEMRVTMAMDREVGEPEIIFAHFSIKRSIESLRKVYRIRKDRRRQPA